MNKYLFRLIDLFQLQRIHLIEHDGQNNGHREAEQKIEQIQLDGVLHSMPELRAVENLRKILENRRRPRALGDALEHAEILKRNLQS